MQRRLVAIALLGLVAVAAVAQPRGSSDFVVIVHPANAMHTVTRAFLADAFLKRVTRWPDGQTIHPIDLAGTPLARQRFAQEVLGRSIPAVRSYWQQLIFTGRGVPPVELGSDTAVVAYVATHPGAVGYVSATTALGTTRALEIQ